MKKKIALYKNVLNEIIETLGTICKAMSENPQYSRYRIICQGHYKALNHYSHLLRGEKDD